MGDKLEEITEKGITKEEILRKVQMSEKELVHILEMLVPLRIGNKLYKIEKNFLYETGSNLIVLYTNEPDLQNRELITLQSFYDVEFMKNLLSDSIMTGYGPAIISNILSQIFDLEHEESDIKQNVFKKNTKKLQLFSSMAVFTENQEYSLKEFANQVIKSEEIVFLDIRKEEFDVKNNIFEEMSHIDLTYLKRGAYIEPTAPKSEKDHIIRAIDYFTLGVTLKERINSLYNLKDKWTKSELLTFLGEFLDDFKGDLGLLLSKEFRSIKEKNPFDVSKQVTYYIKKF